MRDIDDFLPEVLLFAPHCPEPLALNYIRETARDLCRSARLWRETSRIRMAGPVYETIRTSTDSSIVDIEQAEIVDDPPRSSVGFVAPGQGRVLTPVTVHWLNDNHPAWFTETTTGSAKYVFQVNPNTISIYPKQTGMLIMKQVLQPSLTAVLLPDWLYDLYRTVIGRGAASKALMTPSDFANPSLGAAMHAEFRGKAATIKTEAIKGQQGARLRTRGNWF